MKFDTAAVKVSPILWLQVLLYTDTDFFFADDAQKLVTGEEGTSMCIYLC